MHVLSLIEKHHIEGNTKTIREVGNEIDEELDLQKEFTDEFQQHPFEQNKSIENKQLQLERELSQKLPKDRVR